jgi:hypothetical protein
METFNPETLITLLLRFGITLAGAFVLVRFIYRRRIKAMRRRRTAGYVFNYMAMPVIAFLLCFFLSGVELGIGVGVGLFAVFAIFRYRTVKIPVRELAYLFLTIGLAVINSLVGIHLYYVLLVNAIVLLLIYLVETGIRRDTSRKGKHLKSCHVVYHNLENIAPQRKEMLFNDLESVTGLSIREVSVQRIEIEKQKVHLKIWY